MQSEWDRWAMRVGIAGIAAMAVMALAMNANAVSDQSWQHRARLDAPQRMLPIGIGAAVAASETGCIAVGGGRDGDVGVDAGAVAIWNCTANSLALREIVSHPAARTNTAFGQAVAFDAAATTLCIGAPNEDGTLKESGKWPENFQMGRVYIYAPRSVAPHETNGAHWQLWATLESPRPETSAHFGSVVATDGARIVVGSPDHNEAEFAAGRADVFVRRGESWIFESELALPTPAAGMRFGTSIAIRGDTIVVGSPSFSGFGYGSGRADIFRLEKNLKYNGWRHAGRMDAPSPQEGAWFGMSVAIASDIIAVGAPRETPTHSLPFPAHAGVVHLFGRNHTEGATDDCRPLFALTSPQPWCGALPYRPEAFGISLSIRRGILAVGASESCNPLAAGNEHTEGEGSGAVYLFQPADHASHGEIPWNTGAQLVARITAPDASFDVHDGFRVALGCAQPIDGAELRSAIPFLVAGRSGNPDMPAGPGAAHVYWPQTTPQRPALEESNTLQSTQSAKDYFEPTTH